MVNRRNCLKKMGVTALGAAALGTGATGTVAAGTTCDGDGDCLRAHTGWQKQSAYDKLDDRHATIGGNLTVGISPAQPAPQGDWRYYINVHHTNIAWYDDNQDPAPLLGKKRVKIRWPESDQEHIEYPEETNNDWIGQHEQEEYQDYDLQAAAGTFTWETAMFALDLAEEAVPDPVDVSMAVADYVQGLSEVAEDLGGWFDSWNKTTYKWMNPTGAAHTSFVMFELDRIEPGEEIRFEVNAQTNQRRNGTSYHSWYGDERTVDRTVTAPSYEAPDPTDSDPP
jgi:hypothetical protein